MGYYTGAGETTGGGEAVTNFMRHVFNGLHIVHQKKTTVVNRKAGVSLAAAQSAGGSCTLTDHTFWIGSAWYAAPSCKGTVVGTQYSQINGSNLYELTTTTDVYQANIDSSAWVS